MIQQTCSSQEAIRRVGSSDNPSGSDKGTSPRQGSPDPSQSHSPPGSPGDSSDPSSIGNEQGLPRGSGGPGGGGGGGHGPPGQSNMSNDPLPSSKIFRMKPDLSFFPSLSDEGKFTQFYQGFEAAACGTGLGEVVDFSYRPPPGTNEEVSSRNKAMWLYYILYCKVTTTEG